MDVLELFAGSRSIGKATEKIGGGIYSSDIEPFEKIDYVVNILEFDYDKVPFAPDVIWASPPCTGFSVAAIGYHWKIVNGIYIPQTETAKLGIEIAKKTIEIIKHYNPTNFFIENPRGMLRKMDFMQQFDRKTVSYCQYGDSRMKPTDIWTNSTKWIPRKMCKNGDPCHISAPRGSKTGTQGIKGAYNRNKIPEQLCDEILLSCK